MVKKNFTYLTCGEKKLLIQKEHSSLSIARQAELIGVSRSSIYYVPRVDAEELNRLRALDELYTKYPFYGSRRLQLGLADDYQIFIGREQVQRLMRQLGIQAIYPKHRTSISTPGHTIYPYLLKNVPILCPNQVILHTFG